MGTDTGLDVDLGEPVDLWAGLAPVFPASGRPWRRPEGRPLLVEHATVAADPVAWGEPCLSLHESVTDLLDHIFDYSVAPMVGLDGPLSMTAGALMAGRSLAALEARLNMDLTIRPAPAFLLVRLLGSRGTRYYTPEWQGLNRKNKIVEWLTPAGRAAMARLRLRDMRHEGSEFYGDLTARQAGRFIAYFHDLGTHLVRSLRFGEQLFQVFEASADHLAGLKASFARAAAENRICGPMAYGAAQLTRRPWVTSASPILRAGARQDAHHEIWMSDVPGEPPSLLAPRAMPAWSRAAALALLPARSIVGVSFACQALYLEDHRAEAWARIMRAGLCQRFPAAPRAGWRARSPLAGFLASAALSGDEALCRPAVPVLPDLALVLDFTTPGRIANPSAECLAFFAATDPGTGRAAEVEIDCPAFDPARLAIPFLDGALGVTDRGGERFCLVEGVWLGAAEDGRPGIAGAPAEPGAAMLIRHAPRLAGFVRLMAQLQGPGLPPEVRAAMKRAVTWLAGTMSHQPDLLPLRWQALQVARGGGRIAPGSILPDRDGALQRALVPLLESGVDLLALPADGGDLGAAARQLSARLRAFYARLPLALDAGELESKILAAGEALQRRFAGLAGNPHLPEYAGRLFAAGATLCQPPDPLRMPSGIVPGDAPFAILWNAVLGLRAGYAECRAMLLAMQGRTAEAVVLLEREILGPGDGPANPAIGFLASLDALGDALPPIDSADRALLLGEMNALLDLRRSARLLQRADAGDGSAEDGPQLHRLLLLLEILQLCGAAGIPLAPLESLAPAAFAARIDQALTAMAGDCQFA